MSILQFLTRLFRREKYDPSGGHPPLYGGDGLTAQSPVIVNCASLSTAQSLMDKFISERCGDTWERTLAASLAGHETSGKLIRLLHVRTPDGVDHEFYFDLTRPNGVAMEMVGLSVSELQEWSCRRP
ncbi:MAG TPA: hypothetical protein VL027_01005 [Spongiibacteraceae bacterium]|nr:hypothetical protein [Spongiibacteraceae bacterium]